MSQTKKNIVFLVPDAVRPDYVGCYGNSSVLTEEIDKLAADGVQFEDVISAAPWTVPSVSSHLTGKYPHRMDIFGSDFTIEDSPVESIFRKLSDAEYTTGLFLDSEKMYETWSADVDYYGMSLDIQGVLDFISDNSDNPFMFYNLYRGTHLPYVLKYSVESWYRAQKETLDKLRYGGDEGVEECKYRYERSIEQFSEWYLRAVVDRLKNEDILEETIIVLMSDHGECWGERLEDRAEMDAFDLHGPHLYNEVLKVPLILYNVGNASGKVVSKTVRSIDVVPTILEEVGIEYEKEDTDGLDGVSLQPLIEDETIEDIRSEHAISSTTAYENPDETGISAISKLAVVRGDWKLIWTHETDETELYNLERDPDEQTNVADEHESTVADLKPILREELRTAEEVTADDEADSAVKERLEDLGYL